METSIWSSVGSRVVSRWSQSPGASSAINTRLPWCLPAKRISSYAIPAITGSRTMRLVISQYHAAEHKAINAYEAGEELTPENAQRHSLIHPRCGTAFLLWVMVVSVFVYALLGRPIWYWLIVSRIVLLPVIAGIAYELIRFAGKHSDNRILMTLLAPGLWLQRLTTREPSLDQLEVSIKALKEVLDLEGREQPADRRVEVMA